PRERSESSGTTLLFPRIPRRSGSRTREQVLTTCMPTVQPPLSRELFSSPIANPLGVLFSTPWSTLLQHRRFVHRQDAPFLRPTCVGQAPLTGAAHSLPGQGLGGGD